MNCEHNYMNDVCVYCGDRQMGKYDHMSIEELELKIMAHNVIIKWLRSEDPMLRDPQYSPFVHKRIREYEEVRNQLLQTCREKKVARDGDNKPQVGITLKPAEMVARRG